jgi:hypothetical protein
MNSTEDILQDTFMHDRLQQKDIDNNFFKKILEKIVTFITVSRLFLLLIMT